MRSFRQLPVHLALLALVLLASPAYADGPPPSPDDVVSPPIGAPAAHLVAFDAGSLEVAPAPAPVLAPLPAGVDPSDDVGAFALLLVQAVRTGNWWALVALILSMTVSLARKFLSQKFPFLATDRGGFLTVVALSLSGALASGLLSGTPIGLDLLMDGLKIALAAAGGFVGFKKVFLDGDKIAEAGNAAAAKPSAGAAGVVGPSKPLGS